jgi:hypothetical protein
LHPAALHGGETVSAWPWDERSRAPLRVGLAVVATSDLVSLGVDVGHTRPLLVAMDVAIGIAALVAFATSRWPITSGAIALVAIGAVAEAQAALLGGPQRHVFASGAALAGWLAGLAWGRGLPRVGEREDLAEAGAIGTLAATYVGAGTSKLLATGFSWADATTLRAVLLAQRRVTDHGFFTRLADYVVEHPSASRALAVATLLIQLGAFLYFVHPAVRIAWGALLLSFHVGVFALTGIGYRSNVALLLIFTFPWPRLFRSIPSATAQPRDAEVERRALVAAIAVAAVLVALAWLVPLRRFTLR